MEQKKTNRANLETNKATFFLMGLVVALSTVFVAFEWGKKDIVIQDVDQNVVIEEIEDIQITPPEENEPMPEPEPQAPVNVEVLQIVEDDVKVADVQIASVDDAADKIQQVFTPPAPTQRSREEVPEDHVFEYLEEMPSYPGGDKALLEWLGKNTKYPPIAQENGIQGKVYVSFIVEKDGSVTDVKVVRSVDPNLDKAAIEAIKKMPKWKPGMQTGKPVRCRFTQPVVFKLQ